MTLILRSCHRHIFGIPSVSWVEVNLPFSLAPVLRAQAPKPVLYHETGIYTGISCVTETACISSMHRSVAHVGSRTTVQVAHAHWHVYCLRLQAEKCSMLAIRILLLTCSLQENMDHIMMA